MSAALGAEPFTVFAASNEAFKMLPVGAFVGLLKPESRDERVRTLKYRAIAGRVTSRELGGKKFNRKSARAQSCRSMKPRA